VDSAVLPDSAQGQRLLGEIESLHLDPARFELMQKARELPKSTSAGRRLGLFSSSLAFLDFLVGKLSKQGTKNYSSSSA
jgi:hypothetical protein